MTPLLKPLVKVLSFSFASLSPSLLLAFISFGFHLLYRTMLIIIEVTKTSRLLYSFSTMGHTPSHINTIYCLLNLLAATLPRFKIPQTCRLPSAKRLNFTNSTLSIIDDHHSSMCHTVLVFQVHYQSRNKKFYCAMWLTSKRTPT